MYPYIHASSCCVSPRASNRRRPVRGAFTVFRAGASVYPPKGHINRRKKYSLVSEGTPPLTLWWVVLPDLEQLESFGWIFTPTRLAAGAISADEAVERVQSSAWGAASAVDIHPTAAWYTEKGRFRMAPSGIRTTLYLDHPVWVVTIQGGADSGPENALDHTGCGRHMVVDAFTGKHFTAFVAISSPGSLETWDLHQPLEMPELTERQAIAEVLDAEGNDELRALPISAEYGSWQRLIPGCIQIIDVWKIVVDTSSLRRPIPVAGGAAPLEAAWLVLVDDKAGHAWLNTSQPYA